MAVSDERVAPLGAKAEGNRRNGGRDQLALAAALVLLGALSFVVFILPNFLRDCHSSPITACKSNLKNMATVMEMYASDYHGEYPESLDQVLAGGYLLAIPTCPSSRAATYDYFRTGLGERAGFYLVCGGDNHEKFYRRFYPRSSRNFPRYSSDFGLFDHP